MEETVTQNIQTQGPRNAAHLIPLKVDFSNTHTHTHTHLYR